MKGKRTMAHVRCFHVLGLTAIILTMSPALAAQGDPAAIQQKLISQIRLTKVTADRSDIVTPGDVVVLQKDGLMMCSASSPYAFSNTYNNGVLAGNYNNRAKDAAKGAGLSIIKNRFGLGGGSVTSAANNACPSRKFVVGEKFWISGVTVQKDGILVSTFSDPYPDPTGNQIRYYGEVKFPFASGSVPPVDDFVKKVGEVITVQQAELSANQGGQPAPATAPLPVIAPPPPPADVPPPTIEIGQKIDKVTAGFGQPQRIAKIGVKTIYYYKDMKVIFTNGKVSNVE
jgi:hypothetical protein